MKKIILIRPIRNTEDTEDIKEISMKEEKDMCASDFYDVNMSIGEKVEIGAMEPAICNLCGLTSSQVASMHIKDYMMLSEEVGKYLM